MRALKFLRGCCLLTTVVALGGAGCGDDVGADATSTGSPTTGGQGGDATTSSSTSGGFGGSGGSTTTTTGSTGGGGSGTGGSGGEQPAVVECEGSALTPPAEGTCAVTSVGTSGKIFRGTVLTPDQVLHRGEILVTDEGVIACAACDCTSIPEAADASVIECADGVISPGLINPHDHITYANNAPRGANSENGHGTERYDHRHEWRKGLNNHKKISVNSGASAAVVQAAELRFVMSGATSAASAGGKPGLLRNLDTTDLEGLAVQPADSDTFPLGDSSGTMRDSGCDYGGNKTSKSSIASLDGYLPHISEGIGAEAENEFACLSEGSNDLIAHQTAVIHAIGFTANDIAALRTDAAGVIWSPRSNVDLYGNTAPVTALDTMGVQISLGTDWLPSGSMNILRELHCADELNTNYYGGHFSDLALWRMVTINAAFATGAQNAIGMLKPGMVADIAIFNGKTRKDHRAVIGANVDDVVLVLRGGDVLYGDEALVSESVIGGTGCEAIDVCGTPKKACVAQDIGGAATLAAVRAAGEEYYPLFSCDAVPEGEPSCVPYRSEYSKGITAEDGDGDGIDDGNDDCPTVFNPIRPMDGDEQADFDDDGKGDACDPCPLAAEDGCPGLDANDNDGDRVSNGTDNCPETSNANQADEDEDGQGDACDQCPSIANPLGTACPAVTLTIKAIRDPNHPDHPRPGTKVSFTNAYVTALRPDSGGSRGFYVQDSETEPFSGIFVFTQGNSPGVKVGNRVSVSGVYDEYFGLSEISDPEITVDQNGTTLPFGPIAVANPASIANGGASAEGYESMLVSVSNVTILDVNPDEPQDFDEFVVTGNLRIDDQNTDATVDAGLDNVCAVGTTFRSIVGVHGFSFDNYKLQPRSEADVISESCPPFSD